MEGGQGRKGVWGGREVNRTRLSSGVSARFASKSQAGFTLSTYVFDFKNEGACQMGPTNGPDALVADVEADQNL